jgi:hypothetical protein
VVVVAAVGATTAVVTTAVAKPKPKSPVVRGSAYKGALAPPRTSFVVTFKVSKSGQRVTSLRINNLPFYCSGGGKPVPISFRDAKISKRFTFQSTGVQTIKVGPKKGQKGAKLTITGRFIRGRSELGTITTRFPATVEIACNGTTTYTTKAV